MRRLDPAVRAALALLWTLAASACAPSLQRRLLRAQPPAALPSPGSRGAAPLLESYGLRLDTVGVQVGRHHFSELALPGYLDASGLPDLAWQAHLALRQRLYRLKQDHLDKAFANDGEDPLSTLVASAIAAPIREGAQARLDAAFADVRRRAISPGDPLQPLVASYEGLLQGAGDPGTASVAGGLEALPLQAALGPNRSLADWKEDFQVDRGHQDWLVGYRYATPSAVVAAYGGPEEQAAYRSIRRQQAWAFAADAVAMGAALLTAYGVGDPGDEAYAHAVNWRVTGALWALASGASVTWHYGSVHGVTQLIQSLNVRVGAWMDGHQTPASP